MIKQKLALLLLAGMFLSACGHSGDRKTTLAAVPPLLSESGIVSRDTILSGEVGIDRDILVLPGVTLTIRPGTRLLFMPTKKSRIEPRFLYAAHEILIQGRLIARGEADAPIIFSSAAETPKTRDWAGIILDNNNSNESIIEYCRIEYSRVGVYCIGSSPKIINNSFRHNETAIICQREARPQIKNNSITKGKIGIACWDRSVPLISQNNISEQEQAGLLWAGESSPWLENNVIYNNKYGLFGSEPLEWVNNQIEKNTQDFYISNSHAE